MEKTSFFTSDLASKYSDFRVRELHGRYITYKHIEPILNKLKSHFTVREIGKSSLGTPVKMVEFGKGEKKILAWSQMHGNESTTTKAVFDLLNLICSYQAHPIVKLLEEQITLRVIPMLNPDGAMAYTRVNTNEIDLNRDAHNRTQVESTILRRIFDEFQPNWCFNLHDQRTIFSAGQGKFPATVSFLTPALDQERSVAPSRIQSMKLIVAMNRYLQNIIPGQVGRYDDAYNINCTGDTFQTLEVPTILFEAGHYARDYQREKTRELILNSLFCALSSIATGKFENMDYTEYFKIPENEKLFYDVILRKARVEDKIVDVAIQFKETLEEEKIIFIPVIDKIDTALHFFGHKEIECDNKELTNCDGERPAENDVVHKLLLKNEILIINYANN